MPTDLSSLVSRNAELIWIPLNPQQDSVFSITTDQRNFKDLWRSTQQSNSSGAGSPSVHSVRCSFLSQSWRVLVAPDFLSLNQTNGECAACREGCDSWLDTLLDTSWASVRENMVTPASLQISSAQCFTSHLPEGRDLYMVRCSGSGGL